MSASSDTMMEEYRFNDRHRLADELAQSIGLRLRTALDQRERASLVVSGGSTPVLLFRRLRLEQLDWTRVDITLADERWVDPAHPDSNERLVRGELLQGPAARARFVPLKNAAPTPDEGVNGCETRLRTIPRPFDIVMLGMGGDGHTASLFPSTVTLREGLNPDGSAPCLPSHPATAAHPRMTLTLNALLDSRQLIVHIEGSAKLEVFEKARRADDSEAMPICAFLRQERVPLDVYWAP